MEKKIYRIEIPSKLTGHVFKFWIGASLDLVSTREQAAEVTFDQHLEVMERIDCVAIAFDDGGGK